jgi:hypothetical protein
MIGWGLLTVVLVIDKCGLVLTCVGLALLVWVPDIRLRRWPGVRRVRSGPELGSMPPAPNWPVVPSQRCAGDQSGD